MLEKISVLIVEDEFLIGLDLADEVVALGGVVLGPVSSVSAALALLKHATPDAAVLDAMLPDGEFTPVGLMLSEREVPFVVYTGTGLPPALMGGKHDPRVYMKPLPVGIVLEGLEAEMRCCTNLPPPATRAGRRPNGNLT